MVGGQLARVACTATGHVSVQAVFIFTQDEETQCCGALLFYLQDSLDSAPRVYAQGGRVMTFQEQSLKCREAFRIPETGID